VKILVQLRPFNFDGPAHNFNYNAFVKKGTEVIERNLVIKQPQLWNPWDRGEPNLYELTVTLNDGATQTDSVSGMIGLRDIKMAPNAGAPKGSLDRTFVINGEREFIRGANWVPADSLMGRVRDEDYEELIGMAKDAHINMLRVWGGGLREKRSFYEICSREGILVWQEFPFANIFLGHLPRDESFLQLAEKEVGDIVKSVVNYPCVAVYCGGNEFSPTRNSKLLVRVARAVRNIDLSRVFLPAFPARGDSHSRLVWRGFGNVSEYQEEICRFASEFGLQAPPHPESLKKFLGKKGLWPRGAEWSYHKADLERLDRYAGSARESRELEQYVEASQKMQAFAFQIAIEHFRRRKYECSGAMLRQFNDPWPAISWSVIDYYRAPKLAYDKLKEVYSPVLISLKYALKRHKAGETLPIEVWIVSDLLRAVDDCMLDVHMDDEGESLMKLSFDVGTIPPDSSKRYFQFGLKLPARSNWMLRATLRSRGQDISANSYDLSMLDEGEATFWDRFRDRMGRLVLS
jgi:beta-mannosidase